MRQHGLHDHLVENLPFPRDCRAALIQDEAQRRDDRSCACHPSPPQRAAGCEAFGEAWRLTVTPAIALAAELVARCQSVDPPLMVHLCMPLR